MVVINQLITGGGTSLSRKGHLSHGPLDIHGSYMFLSYLSQTSSIKISPWYPWIFMVDHHVMDLCERSSCWDLWDFLNAMLDEGAAPKKGDSNHDMKAGHSLLNIKESSTGKALKRHFTFIYIYISVVFQNSLALIFLNTEDMTNNCPLLSKMEASGHDSSDPKNMLALWGSSPTSSKIKIFETTNNCSLNFVKLYKSIKYALFLRIWYVYI